jgi:hypothetical protein
VTGAEFSEVDFDLLADYVGGALTGTLDEAAVAARIAGDPAWQRAHDELAGAMAAVGAELSALGAVSEPMPAELVVRLDIAFASAVAESAVADPAVADPAPIDPELAAPATPFVLPAGAGAASGRHLSAVPGEGVDRGVGERKRTTAADRRRWRWAAPIAAAAGVIAFVGVGINYLSGQSNSENATSSAAGSGERKDSAGTPMLAPDSAASAAGTQVLASGRDYRLATLASAPESGPAEAAGTRSESSVAAAPRPAVGVPLDRLTPGDALQACLDAIERQNGAGAIIAPVVDYARFDGNPALIVRFSAPNGSWVWATGPDCGVPGAGAAKLGSVKVG